MSGLVWYCGGCACEVVCYWYRILQNWYQYSCFDLLHHIHTHSLSPSYSHRPPSRTPPPLSPPIIYPSDQTRSIIKRDPFTLFPEKALFFFVKGKEKKRINKIGWCVEGKGGESGVQDFAVWKREGYLTCSSLVLVVWCVRAVAIL